MQTERVAGSTQTRGDRQRDAIVTAVQELIAEQHSFADLSVSAISERAGVGRSGFYFYFDTKYGVLAHMFGTALAELDELTRYFAPRADGESAEDFAHRMVGSAVQMYAHNEALMRACVQARPTDQTIAKLLDDLQAGVVKKIVSIAEVEIAEHGARPISDDLYGLVRMLVATTGMALSGDTSFIGEDGDLPRAVELIETLWRTSLLGR